MAQAAYQLSVPSLVAGALTLTAALAWNEAAKAGMRALYPRPTKDSFAAMLAYAVIVTLVVLIVLVVARKTSAAAHHHFTSRSAADTLPETLSGGWR